MIGGEGGSVVLDGSTGVVQVHVPPGAVDTATLIEIAEAIPPATLPDDLLVGGQVYAITAESDSFQELVTVTLPIPGGVDPELDYSIMWFDPESSSWITIQSTVDQSSDNISCQVDHFSLFGMFASGSTIVKLKIYEHSVGYWILPTADAESLAEEAAEKTLQFALDQLLDYALGIISGGPWLSIIVSLAELYDEARTANDPILEYSVKISQACEWSKLLEICREDEFLTALIYYPSPTSSPHPNGLLLKVYKHHIGGFEEVQAQPILEPGEETSDDPPNFFVMLQPITLSEYVDTSLPRTEVYQIGSSVPGAFEHGEATIHVGTYEDHCAAIVSSCGPTAYDQTVEVTKGTTTLVILFATDDDTPIEELVFSIVAYPVHGFLSAVTDGLLTYTPDAGYVGPDSFTFKANDGDVDSNIATVSITVSEDAGSDGGSIVAWGENGSGQLDVPLPNTDFVAIASGHRHSFGLKADRSLVAWGWNDSGQIDVPSPNTGFVAAAAGSQFSLALKANGSIVAWGASNDGMTDVPSPNADFVAISAGWFHSLGLRADGSIAAWGMNYIGQRDVPSPNADFVAVAGGGEHSLGLKLDGSVVGWGSNDVGQIDVPSPNTNFVAISAGLWHSLGLKADGSIVVWGAEEGMNWSGVLDVPSPNTDFVAIAGGGIFILGLKANGSIVAWGDNRDGQLDIPSPNTGFVAIAGGKYHSLGLRRASE